MTQNLIIKQNGGNRNELARIQEKNPLGLNAFFTAIDCLELLHETNNHNFKYEYGWPMREDR